MNTTQKNNSLPLNEIEALREKINQLELENRILKETLANKPKTQIIKPQGIGANQSEPKAPNLKTTNKQTEIIAAFAISILGCKDDLKEPRAAAKSLIEELSRIGYGNIISDKALAEYLATGIERLDIFKP